MDALLSSILDYIALSQFMVILSMRNIKYANMANTI